MSIEIVKSAKLKCSMCGREETVEISETNVPTNYNLLVMRGITVHIDSNITYDTDNYVEIHICDKCRDKVQNFIKGNYKIIALNIKDTFTNISSIYSLSSVSDKELVGNDDIKEKIIDYCHNYMDDKLPVESSDLEYNINNIVNDIRKYGSGSWVIGNLFLEAFYLK